jgi:hypothetical protein
LYFTDQNCLNVTSVGPAIDGLGTPAWTAISTSLTTPTNAQTLWIGCFLGVSSVDQLYLNPNANSY